VQGGAVLGLIWLLLFSLLCASPARTNDLVFCGHAEIPKRDGYAGLSGIEVVDEGNAFIAVSDRGAFVTGRIRRDDGRPIKVDHLKLVPFLPQRGKARVAPTGKDAEGLALGPDGTVYVSFELWHRVWRWTDIHKNPIWQPDNPDAKRFGRNTGLEALAFGPDGALYTLPETLVDDGMIPVYRYRDRLWDRPFTVPARGAFHPVGADFGPDDRFYLLERDFSPPFGFRSRIRSFAFGPEGFTDERTLLKTPLGRHGNLEGLSVWKGADGDIRLTMITDDNGLPVQRNEIVEYRLASDRPDR